MVSVVLMCFDLNKFAKKINDIFITLIYYFNPFPEYPADCPTLSTAIERNAPEGRCILQESEEENRK